MGKVGGSPLWLLQDGPENCSGCENSLDFMLQIYCPLEMPQAYHRYVYVFSCSICREIHIYRAQLPQDNPLHSDAPADFSDSEDIPDDELLSLLSAPQSRAVKSDLGLAIIDEDEDITRAVRELFTLDLRDTQAVEDFIDRMPEDSSDVSLPQHTAEEEEDEEVLHKERQQDEDVSFELLRVSAMRQRRQCVRYDRGGVPMWYSDRNRPELTVPDCDMCGGKRSFEFQVMPQAIDVAGLELDFGSIFVFTCEQSCEGAGYIREACVVQDSL